MEQISFNRDQFAEIVSKLLVADLGLAHQYTGAPRGWKMNYTPLDPYAFKKHYQVTEFLKKYSFEKDLYTPPEVKAMSIEKFLDNQKRIENHVISMSPLVKEIVFRARGWIDHLLGDYDLDEHLQECYFPKKASVGTSRKNATLSYRWQRGITGSQYHLDWFNRVYLPWQSHYDELDSRRPDLSSEQRVVTELPATLVEKTYKSERMIVPNSGVGGLYSNGIGAVMVKRLRAGGYDVKVLPDVHKRLAQAASRNGHSATVDQTLASDNITTEHVELLLSMRWAKVLLNGRIGTLVIDGTPMETKTMSTMGIGFTFPLQMVIFLGLTHACLDYYRESGSVENPRISVFGDDLICPVEIRNLLTEVFVSLGFKFNEEKSFWCGPFRESCGGDYYRGFDVRPAYLPRWKGHGSKRSLEAYLYKVYNVIKKRWMLEEVPSTLAFVVDQIQAYCRDKPFVVPPSFGDDSGLRLTLSEIHKMDLRYPKRDEHGTYYFDRLGFIASLKEEKNHDYYYWERLRLSANNDSCFTGPSSGPVDTVVDRDRLRSARESTRRWTVVTARKSIVDRIKKHRNREIPEPTIFLVDFAELERRTVGKTPHGFKGQRDVIVLNDDVQRYETTRSSLCIWE